MTTKLRFRTPIADDGLSVNKLIALCPPLDGNSLYCNLLQCTHFSDTSVAAEMDGELCGFVSGYRIPQRPDTLFIWQVAVAEEARGMRLASKMIIHILSRLGQASVNSLETTISPGNDASWALFRGLARDLESVCEESVLFDTEQHFSGQHESEILMRIGPFSMKERKL